MTSLIGIDVGGTKVAGVLVRASLGTTSEPEILTEVRRASDAGGGEVLDRIVSVAAELVGRAGEPGDVPPAIGVGLAGFVDLAGVVRRSPNAPGLEGVDVAGAVGAATGSRVVVDNDANCVAVAAAALCDPPVQDLIAVTLGTGIGGGLIVGGRLVRGARGFAGEPGHMVLDPDGPPCPCGQRGCWERYASGPALVTQAREALAAGRAPELTGAAAAPGGLDGEAVAAAVAAGGEGARAVLEAFAGHVALGLANLVALLDPARIVLGGGVAELGEDLLVPVRASLESHAAVAGRAVEVCVAPHGALAGAVGAALIAAR